MRELSVILAIDLDLLAPDAADEIVSAAVEKYGRLDVVVNCLGGPTSPGLSSLDRDDASWVRAFELNVMGVVRMVRAALPVMPARGSGTFVHVASDLARQPDPAFADHAAMKAAVLNLCKSLSIEYGSRIRSNVLSPGPTRTSGLVDYFATHVPPRLGLSTEEVLLHYANEVRQMPSGRLGTAEEVANAALFLASDLTGQITGTELVIDGGNSEDRIMRECHCMGRGRKPE